MLNRQSLCTYFSSSQFVIIFTFLSILPAALFFVVHESFFTANCFYHCDQFLCEPPWWHLVTLEDLQPPDKHGNQCSNKSTMANDITRNSYWHEISGDRSSIRENIDYFASNYSYLPVSCKPKRFNHASRPEIVVIVIGNSMDAKNRTVIRETWGTINFYPWVKSRVIFVVGKNMAEVVNLKIRNEFHTYDDVIQVDKIEHFTDPKFPILLKLSGIRFALSKCNGFQFLILTELHVFVNTFSIASNLVGSLSLLSSPSSSLLYPRQLLTQFEEKNTLFCEQRELQLNRAFFKSLVKSEWRHLFNTTFRFCVSDILMLRENEARLLLNNSFRTPLPSKKLLNFRGSFLSGLVATRSNISISSINKFQLQVATSTAEDPRKFYSKDVPSHRVKYVWHSTVAKSCTFLLGMTFKNELLTQDGLAQILGV